MDIKIPLNKAYHNSTFLTEYKGRNMVKSPHDSMRKGIYDRSDKSDIGYHSRKSMHIKRAIIPAGMCKAQLAKRTWQIERDELSGSVPENAKTRGYQFATSTRETVVELFREV